MTARTELTCPVTGVALSVPERSVDAYLAAGYARAGGAAGPAKGKGKAKSGKGRGAEAPGAPAADGGAAAADGDGPALLPEDGEDGADGAVPEGSALETSTEY